MTEWRVLDDFPEYSVNEYGTILSHWRDRPIAVRQNHQGFLMAGLVSNQVQLTRSVALLVAKAFLDPPRNEAYNSVIHLNGDRGDCRAMNLMWRPRWYSVKYHQMFDEDPIRVSVFVPDLGRVFHSLREFCTTYGLIEQHTYIDMINEDPCFHYGWKIERYDKVSIRS